MKWAGIWLLSRANSTKPLFRKTQTSLIAPPSGSMLVMLFPVLGSQILTMCLSAVISLGSVELSVWCHLIFNIGLPYM
uniref:Uncharacterized protein n=1 Tax=Zea mays TaxID=4577 RepID=C4J1W3_MAIZE|nr:unknown [Zea mays]